jgi:hypothetical protein
MSLRAANQEWRRPLQHLVTTYLDLPDVEGLTAFTTRFSLAVLDLLETPDAAAARQVVADLHRRAMWANDGYAARDALSHPLSRRLASEQAAKDSSRLVSACKLQSGTLPPGLRGGIIGALRTAQCVIRESLDQHVPTAISVINSEGKTTTKWLLSGVLSTEGPTVATPQRGGGEVSPPRH